MGPPSFMRSVVSRNVVMRRITIFSHTSALTMAMLWLRVLVSGLSSWRYIFDPRPGNVGFVVDKVALGQIFLSVPCFLLSVSFRQCSTLIFIYMFPLTRRTKVQSLGTLKKKTVLSGMSRCHGSFILTSVTMVILPSPNTKCSHGLTLLLTAIRWVHPTFSSCTSYMLHGSLPPCDASTCDEGRSWTCELWVDVANIVKVQLNRSPTSTMWTGGWAGAHC